MTRKEFEELLPWYATGALDPEEAQAIESYLAESPEARAELASFRALHEVVQDTGDEPEWNPGLIHEAFARIDGYERERSERAATRATRAAGGVLGWLRRNLIPAWEGTPFLARAALVAQLALMLALGGALFVAGSGEDGFRTVGGSEVPASDDRARIALGFAGHMSEEGLRALLREIEGEIVGGPSALGLYTVAVPGDRATVDALLERLGDDQRLQYAARIR